MRRPWSLVGLLVALPVAAFVFVPNRAGVEARWAIAQDAETDCHIASDLDANVYLATAEEVRALDGRNGTVRWTWGAPEEGHKRGKTCPAGSRRVTPGRVGRHRVSPGPGTGRAERGVNCRPLRPASQPLPRQQGAIGSTTRACPR